MAILKFQNQKTTSDLNTVREELSSLGVELSQWNLPESTELTALLAKDSLSDTEKNQVLELLDFRFADLKRTSGYQARDLIVLHPQVPNLDGLLSQFDKIHTHDDDEVRYIIDGSGSFGFHRKDGSQILLTVEAGEYIRVPQNTKHWFVLDSGRRIKAVRYFTSKDGWVANYTADSVIL